MPIGFTSSQTIGNWGDFSSNTDAGCWNWNKVRWFVDVRLSPVVIKHPNRKTQFHTTLIFRWSQFKSFYFLRHIPPMDILFSAALSCKLESHLSSTPEHRFCTRNAKKAKRITKIWAKRNSFVMSRESNAINFITHLHQVDNGHRSRTKPTKKHEQAPSLESYRGAEKASHSIWTSANVHIQV